MWPQERLLATGKLWITIKYFHPYLAYRDIDWDKALIDALPAVREAKSSSEYAAALNKLLAPLNDPETMAAQGEPGAPQEAAGPQRIWIHNGLPRPNSDFYSAFVIAEQGSAPSVRINMGESVQAVVRLSEPAPAQAAAAPSPRADRDYSDTPYPSAEYRILAAYKIWGTIRYFFGYRDLTDEDWDDAFAQYLPKIIDAKDAREYNLAIAEMLTHTSDSQTVMQSREMTKYFGECAPGVKLRLIEKKPVITEVDDDAKMAGARVGDIVRMIDNENVVDRFHRDERYTPASTTQSIGYLLMQRILNGPANSMAQITVESANGQLRNLHLKRDNMPAPAPTGEAFKLLNSKIGYADLCRLRPEEVDPMFERFGHAAGIIFDMRCGAQQTALQITSRLTAKSDIPAAIVTGPLALRPDVPTNEISTSTASYFLVETIPNNAKPKYTGKTVMLVDERTQGPGEYAGLLLEAANKTEFMGTASAGAVGETSEFVVPGGITIQFSGREVRHGNGGALQRLGLQPGISVAPTIAGIRGERDEVLEKAIEYLL